MLQQFQEEGDASFKRLVIVSDGVDNKSLGYTREELYALLEEHPYPIYTIGCTNGNNNEELENMYALSRMTGGESYHLDDVEDAITVVQGVASLNSAVKVRVVLQKEAMDGTEKGVYLQLTTADGQTYEDSVEMQMPFGAVSQAPETQTPPAEIAPETVPSTEPETAPEPERATVLDRLQELPIGAVIAVAIGAAALVVILVALVVSRKKGAKAPVQEEPRREPAPRMRETKMLHNEAAGPKAGRNTRAIFPTAPKRVVVLQDVQQPLRRFEAELSAPVLVGYDPDCTIRVDYNETVSGRHCLITEENGKLYIANLSRSNGTVVNGKKIADKTELYSGATIELGSVKMRVDLA